jgi:hypothetical protein
VAIERARRKERAAAPMSEQHVTAVAIEADGLPIKTLVIEAQHELVLRCGKSSLTLTREGKIIVKGVKIVSRASQRNSIKGAQIDLN